MRKRPAGYICRNSLRAKVRFFYRSPTPQFRHTPKYSTNASFPTAVSPLPCRRGNHIFAHAVDLVTENQAEFFTGGRRKSLQCHAFCGLLYHDLPPFGLQRCHRLSSTFMVRPCYRRCSAERGLLDLPVGGVPVMPVSTSFPTLKSIGSAKGRPNVVQASTLSKKNANRYFFCSFEFIDRKAAQLVEF